MKIIHASDLHIGESPIVYSQLEKAIEEINKEKADLILITGDITHNGIHEEFEIAREYLKKFKNFLAVPGNHDSQNVGYEKFEKFINKRNFAKKIKGINIIGIDSTEPDLDEGHVGRDKYSWIEKNIKSFSIVMMHHHIIPVPGSGRERHTITDAGDFLKLITDKKTNLVLCGHKHTCNLWNLNETKILNTSTLSSIRTRGVGRGYNVIELDRNKIKSVEFKSLDSWCKNKRLF